MALHGLIPARCLLGREGIWIWTGHDFLFPYFGSTMELTLHRYLANGDGPTMDDWSTSGFEVRGVPHGHDARIALMDGRWSLLHSSPGHPRPEWEGSFASADDALAYLRDRVMKA